MSVKIYKRTDCSRSLNYQDSLLEIILIGNEHRVFLDDGRDVMFRTTKRQENNEVHVASVALMADTESEAVEVLKKINTCRATLHCPEEKQVWKTPIPKLPFLIAWKDARKRGAAKRGAEMSASSKKAATAAKLKLIEDDLRLDEYTTKELLDRVGVKSVNSIKNHYGISREQMQVRYKAELKRKERRNAKR